MKLNLTLHSFREAYNRMTFFSNKITTCYQITISDDQIVSGWQYYLVINFTIIPSLLKQGENLAESDAIQIEYQLFTKVGKGKQIIIVSEFIMFYRRHVLTSQHIPVFMGNIFKYH